ncbi:lipoprotein BA_5634 family protein [Bacillus gaemokensis]|uniref:Lipoprotein n=1 Tax=Bacillus gaemokensis TaxID=574375 RepID=A0A073K705_9BACI|nr:lipoprotein BA_5634 family protein [Bacillus gaemokensis]KEK23054.1 hypothetical protein BAGA_14590 [Bacillus gaemokensis]KYG37725.1 hypothetical protein AZF08_22550 [Bacillus gaemokensis]
MKRKMIIYIVATLTLFSMSACSLFGKKEEPANGMLLLGDEQSVSPLVERYKKETTSKELYKVKLDTKDEKKILIINETVAKKFIQKGILQKRDNDEGMISSEPITSLPKFTKDKAILFANKEDKNMKDVMINNEKISVQYDSDTWLGGIRSYEFEGCIIVLKDAQYDKIPVPQINMELLSFNKSLGDMRSHNPDDKINKEYVTIKKLMKGTSIIGYELVTITTK